jgi:hypothetical protein
VARLARGAHDHQSVHVNVNLSPRTSALSR